MRIFFSNRLEMLFQRLKEGLFDQSHPFSKRFLIVPSREMEEWVRLRLANDRSFLIATGITTLSLSQAIARFSVPLPTRLQVTLLLEEKISEILATESNSSLWLPLITYLKGHQRRLMPLCKELARLFLKYGLYNCPLPQDHWQTHLWHRLFTADPFNFPLKKELVEEGSIHLFSFSHLAPRAFHFFQALGSKRAVSFYHLSACQEFWSDFVSDKREALFDAHEEMRHPLLANLGQVGRSFAQLVETSSVETEECYEAPGETTQLGSLQRDLLELRPTDKMAADGSIALHRGATPHREIEILFETLTQFLGSGEILPGDVLVMAPDITLYEPFIHAYFGNEIDYQIADLPARANNGHVQGLLGLIDLEKNRWSAPAVLALFDHPLFRMRHRLADEEVLQIRKWIKEGGICWGKEGDHSWSAGLDRLLHRLASNVCGEPIDFTLSELLGTLVSVFESLVCNLAPFSQSDRRPLSEWVLLLKGLSQTYFAGEEEERDRLFSDLDRCAKLALHQSVYPFSTVRFLIEEILLEESVTLRRNHVGAARFSSMLPMRAIPAKVIWLLGMNHDAFPRKEFSGCTDLMLEKGRGDYCPTRRDFDRYLFLEALLSARSRLIMSYTEDPPSSVILELASAVGAIETHEHALHPIGSCSPKTEAAPFFGIPREVAIPDSETQVDVHDLRLLARSPLKLFFQNKLGLKFVAEDEVQSDEPFVLSPLDKAHLKRELLTKPLPEVVLAAKRQGRFPSGTFGEIAEKQLEKTQLEMRTFSPLDLAPYTLERFAIFGRVEGIEGEELIVHEKGDFKGCVRAWPLALLANCHRPTKVIFAKDGVEKGPLTDPDASLKLFLEYYLFAKENPSPLLPEWIEMLIKGDVSRLYKVIEQGRIYDEAFLFAHRRRPLPPAERLVEEWGCFAKRIFGGIVDAWF